MKQVAAGAAEIPMYTGFADWRWTHGYAEDVAEAVVLSVTDSRAAGRTYNVGEAVTPTWAERVESIGCVLGWRGRIVPAPSADMPQDFAHHIEVDSSALRGELGYREVVAYGEALRRTVEWELSGSANPRTRD